MGEYYISLALQVILWWVYFVHEWCPFVDHNRVVVICSTSTSSLDGVRKYLQVHYLPLCEYSLARFGSVIPTTSNYFIKIVCFLFSRIALCVQRANALSWIARVASLSSPKWHFLALCSQTFLLRDNRVWSFKLHDRTCHFSITRRHAFKSSAYQLALMLLVHHSYT